MSILKIDSSNSKDGIKKTIDKESLDVVLETLQKGIYAFPIKSTVRELASNAYDANKEREVAKRILNGIDTVEDHYDITKTDGIYHSSNWDPDYYDQKWLSEDDNIYLFYEEGVQKDVLRIKDHGVGLGADRLTGYFKLSYSSKRSQKGALGKWGLGNKSPLSLGIESFTVINYYNGRKFRFEVYINNVISTTPKFSNGKKNDFITISVDQPSTDEFGNDITIKKDFIFYYEETKDKNGLEVVVPIKKYEKKFFFDAIETQLMYIPNIVFRYKELNEIVYKDIDIAAKVLYRDDNIILSESTLLDLPHILLGAGDGLINYGIVSFEALELEPKRGAVGLILNINDVEVTPPREAVVWSARTRAAVIKSYNAIVETATKLVNKELHSTNDYWDWIQKVASIKSALVNKSSGSSVLQKLSGIIDASTINKIYYKKQGLNQLYTSDIKVMLGDKVLIRKFSYDKYGHKVNREKIKSLNSITSFTTYITKDASNKYKDRYLYEEIENGAFIVIKLLEGYEKFNKLLLLETSTVIKSYDAITVPEDILDAYILENSGDSDENEDTDVTLDPARLARLRKAEQKILYHKAEANYNRIVYASREIKISDIRTVFKDQKVVYASFDERSFINSITGVFPFLIHSNISSYNLPYVIQNNHYSNSYKNILNKYNIDKISPILISKENVKYIKDKKEFSHASKFFIDSYINGKLIVNKNIKFALTMQYLNKLFKDADIFINKESLVSEDILIKFFTQEFINLLLLSSVADSSPYSDIPNYLNNAILYQLNKNKTDDIVLAQYLEAVNDTLPNELCDDLDAILDIDIIHTNLIEKTLEFIKFYKKYKPITDTINYASDLDILEVLLPLVKNYEAMPKEEGYFQ